MRYSHIQRILAAKYRSKKQHIETMLKQLRYRGKLDYNHRFVWLIGREPDMKTIGALDVLLDLTDGKFRYIASGIYPAIIIFSSAPSQSGSHATYGEPEEEKVYFIIRVDRYFEDRVNKYIAGISHDITVILILQDWTQRQFIQSNNPYYFAMQDDKGRYKFYNPE